MMRKLHAWLLLLALLPVPTAWASDANLAASLKQPGHVLMLRHALALGIGDPPDFTLGDCASQRNPSTEGRAQAKAAGEWLRRQGIKQARIYSSQWCRCLDTARLLDLGPVTEMPELNNVFTHPQNRTARPVCASLTSSSSGSPDGPLIILVTHNRNIYHLTGINTGSGEGVLLKLNPGQAPGVTGRVGFGN